MIGNRLASERRRLGLSQADFAPYLGIGRSALAMIETDRAPLDIDRLVKLAEKVGLDPIFVVTGEPSDVAAGKLLNWDLVFTIQKGVDEWCAERGISLTPEKQQLIVKILYRRVSANGGDIRSSIDEAAQLAA